PRQHVPHVARFERDDPRPPFEQVRAKLRQAVADGTRQSDAGDDDSVSKLGRAGHHHRSVAGREPADKRPIGGRKSGRKHVVRRCPATVSAPGSGLHFATLSRRKPILLETLVGDTTRPSPPNPTIFHRAVPPTGASVPRRPFAHSPGTTRMW